MSNENLGLWVVKSKNQVIGKTDKGVSKEKGQEIAKAQPGSRMITLAQHQLDLKNQEQAKSFLKAAENADFSNLKISDAAFEAAVKAARTFSKQAPAAQAVSVKDALLAIVKFESEYPGMVVRDGQVNMGILQTGFRWLKKYAILEIPWGLGDKEYDEPTIKQQYTIIGLAAWVWVAKAMPKSGELTGDRILAAL